MNKLTTAVLGLSLLVGSAFAAAPQAADTAKTTDPTPATKTAKAKKVKKSKKSTTAAAPKTDSATK